MSCVAKGLNVASIIAGGLNVTKVMRGSDAVWTSGGGSWPAKYNDGLWTLKSGLFSGLYLVFDYTSCVKTEEDLYTSWDFTGGKIYNEDGTLYGTIDDATAQFVLQPSAELAVLYINVDNLPTLSGTYTNHLSGEFNPLALKFSLNGSTVQQGGPESYTATRVKE